MARASLNSTLTPTMINRISAGFNRFLNQNGGRPETINQDWAEKLGIQNTSDAFFPTFNFGHGSTEVPGRQRWRSSAAAAYGRPRMEAGC